MPYREFKRKLTARYLAPFVVAMLALTALVLWRLESQISSVDWVEHSDQVILRTKDAEIQMQRINLAVIAYLHSPDRRFVDEIINGRHAFARDLARIAALVADNPEQEKRLIEMSDLRETWIRMLENLVSKKDTSDVSANSLAEAETATHKLIDGLEAFVDSENEIRARRKAHQATQNKVLFALVPLLSAAVTVFLSYWGWHQIRQASEQFHQALTAAEQAQARAEQASQAKDNFLGTISHELRNPLNSIMLWAATLRTDQSLSANARRGLAVVDRAVRAQAQLVDDLLDLSSIESGRMRLDVQSVNLAEVVEAVAENMRVAAEAKSITLQEIVDPRVGMLVGDPARLQQVVWNLLSNAVKFTPKDGKIQVRVERINSHVEITVADTGQGIEPAELDSVFDRFWQAENPGQKKLGVGLGLSIAKEIVGLHGGTVSAHSEGAGKGATFIIRLPLPVATAGSIEPRRHPTVAPLAGTASAPRLDGYSILVVDDDLNACDALHNLLSSLGARVSTAISAEAALTMLETVRADAVVSDIGMPVHDGLFLAREIRKREGSGGRNGSRLPLVALTAYGRVEDKVKIFEAGFDNHIVKPVDPAELSAILGTVIGARRV